jgi:methenyltetrahydromethanopterin cyclohydrolase
MTGVGKVDPGVQQDTKSFAMTNKSVPVSVNARTRPLVDALVSDAPSLRIAVERLANGTQVIDAGIKVPGGLEAGRRIAEICLGGLGQVRIRAGTAFANWILYVDVFTSNPVIACLGSQYAGWSLEHGQGKGAFRALGSGPARALGSHEPLFDELGYRDVSTTGVLVLEVSALPPVEIADRVAHNCGIEPANLTLILTPTTSLCGAVQVVARSLEVALHKVHALRFPLTAIVDGMATAPLSPPSPDFMTAMGRANDAILYGGDTHLFVDCGDTEAADLAQRLPSSASRDYGKPFAEVFEDSGHNFYDIDPMLFSPARACITSLQSGMSHKAGSLNPAVLEQSFGSTVS